MISKIISTFLSNEGNNRYQYNYFNFGDIDKIYNSNLIELAHVSIVWRIRQNEVKCQLYAPSFWRKRGFQVISGNPSLETDSWYRLKLTEDSFYPIGSGDGFSFISTILGNTHLLHAYDEIAVKVNLKKRIGNWRSMEMDKYKHFLEGNTLAVESSFYRKLSEYIDLTDESVSHSNIEEIEQKIIGEQYKFECLVGLRVREPKRYDTILSLIDHATHSLSGLNSFEVEATNNSIDPFYHDQFLSKEELHSFISVNDAINVTNNIIEPLEEEVEEIQEDGTIFELLPKSKKTDEVDDRYKDISKQIIQVLKRVGVTKDKGLKLDEEINGLSFVRCQFQIPKDLVYSKIYDKNQDIRVALGVPSLTIEQGSKPDTIAFLIPKLERKPLLLGDILSVQPNQKELSKLDIPFLIGVDPLGEPVFQCLSNLAHLLIAGQSGGGKSVWLNQAILTMIMFMSPKELKLVLIDPKQVELTPFKDFPHVETVETDAVKANLLIEKFILEMEERYELFSINKVKTIKQYNNKNRDNPIPYIVCVVDEFADLRMTNPDIINTIAMLTQKGRAAGIHLIIATQRPDAKIIDGFIKDNLPSKISFRLSSNKSYTTIFGTGVPFKLLGKGHGAMKIEGQLKELEQFQSAAVSLDEKEEERVHKDIIRYINKNGYAKKNEDEGVSEVEELDNLSKIKRVIAETGETRARALREELKISNNAVSDLMKQLVSEGWLNKLEGNKGYEIVANEDELDRWRG